MNLRSALVSGIKQHIWAMTQLPNPLFLFDISLNISRVLTLTIIITVMLHYFPVIPYA